MDNREFENKINRFRQDSELATVSDDFESRVFSKIKNKKKQRKITAAAALGVVVFAFIFIGQAVLFHKDPGQKIMAGSESTIKEEVPVVEDVIFASSDSKANYAIEQVQVGYYEDENTI